MTAAQIKQLTGQRARIKFNGKYYPGIRNGTIKEVKAGKVTIELFEGDPITIEISGIKEIRIIK